MASEPAADEVQFLSPNERRQRNRDEMQKAILDAARAVMREQGVAALSLREVARRVKMQAPSLYTYYPSKMALYDALFLEGIRIAAARHCDLIAARQGSFRNFLQAWAESSMRFAQEHPELYQLCFERPVPGFVPSEASMAESRKLLVGGEKFLDEAVASGEIRLDLPISQARDLIIAMIHGITSQHMANEPETPVGSGRYGGLIPAAVALVAAAWEHGEPFISTNSSPLSEETKVNAGKEVGA